MYSIEIIRALNDPKNKHKTDFWPTTRCEHGWHTKRIKAWNRRRALFQSAINRARDACSHILTFKAFTGRD
jgi:hypothetical protein